MKIKMVKKLRSREVNTKYGQKTITDWVVSEEGEELTKIATLWENTSTKNLGEGEFVYGEIFKSGEYQGKDQFTIRLENTSPTKKEYQAKATETHDFAKENNALLKEILSLLKGKPKDEEENIPF